MPALRPYQQASLDLLAEGMRAGVRHQLLVAPTGSGKGTTVAAMIHRAVTERGKRVLYLVAGRTLVDEFSERLWRQYGLDHGVVMAGHWRGRPREPVQVASIDTLVSHLRNGFGLPPADLVIIDEADLARAARFEDVLAKYPDAFVVGQTATPIRADGKGLGGALFEKLVVAANVRELIDQGWLAEFAGWAFESLDTKDAAVKNGDFDLDVLDERLKGREGERLAGDVVAEWHGRVRGRRTVLFACTIRHSQELAQRFNDAREHGGPTAVAEHVDGTMSRRQRLETFERLRRGETHIISNVGVLTRGVDLPPLEVAQWARPTASLALYLQMAGRVLRPSKETGKKLAYLLDHAGNLKRHGLPDTRREWSLEADVSGSETLMAMSHCPKCGSLFSEGLVACPSCSYELQREEPPPDETVHEPFGEKDGVAIPVEELRRRERMRDADRQLLRTLVTTARLKGWRPKAAEVRFKVRRGYWPTRDMVADAHSWFEQHTGAIA